jgi:hypothetical protein
MVVVWLCIGYNQVVSGMTRLKLKGGVSSPYYQALIQVDADADAESLLIFNRIITKFTYIKGNLNGGIVKVIVPYAYTTINELVVAITDADRVYNIKSVDGVRAEVIDGTVTNILI